METAEYYSHASSPAVSRRSVTATPQLLFVEETVKPATEEETATTAGDTTATLQYSVPNLTAPDETVPISSPALGSEESSGVSLEIHSQGGEDSCIRQLNFSGSVTSLEHTDRNKDENQEEIENDIKSLQDSLRAKLDSDATTTIAAALASSNSDSNSSSQDTSTSSAALLTDTYTLNKSIQQVTDIYDTSKPHPHTPPKEKRRVPLSDSDAGTAVEYSPDDMEKYMQYQPTGGHMTSHVTDTNDPVSLNGIRTRGYASNNNGAKDSSTMYSCNDNAVSANTVPHHSLTLVTSEPESPSSCQVCMCTYIESAKVVVQTILCAYAETVSSENIERREI